MHGSALGSVEGEVLAEEAHRLGAAGLEVFCAVDRVPELPHPVPGGRAWAHMLQVHEGGGWFRLEGGFADSHQAYSLSNAKKFHVVISPVTWLLTPLSCTTGSTSQNSGMIATSPISACTSCPSAAVRSVGSIAAT